MTPSDIEIFPRFPLVAFLALGFALLAPAPSRVFGQTPSLKPEVLIYYANETSPEEEEAASWDTIIGWLASSDNPKVNKIAGQLRRDREQFPKVVEDDLAAFRQHLSETIGLAGAVLFTNRLARRGTYLLFRSGSVGLEEVALEFPRSENLIYQCSVLANPESLGICLREAARQFDPQRYRFVLHSKSHGNARMALTPRLIVRAEQTNREELLSVAAGEIADENLPRWAGRLGITKDQYFGTLQELGDQQGMQFALVFMEACKGVLPDDLKIHPPRNIHRLYMTGPEGAEYVNIDYTASLMASSTAKPLSQVLDAVLAPKFYVLVRGEEPHGTSTRMVRLALYWIPALVVVGWVIYRRHRSRMGNGPSPI